jgi:cephalosporin-C deacetylase
VFNVTFAHSSRQLTLLWAVCLAAPLVTLVAAANGPMASPVPASGAVLSVTPDRAGGIYRVGESAVFTITLTGAPDDADVSWTLQDGAQPGKTGTARLAHGKASVTASRTQPGFVLLKATFRKSDVTGSASAGQELTAFGGAGFDPLRIAPSREAPADFDEFWAAKKAELSTVPLNIRLTPAGSAGTVPDGVELFDAQVDALGAPVSGYYARPGGAAPRSLPAILTFHGAGVDGAYAGVAAQWAQRGCLALDINAHGIANGMPAAFYAELQKSELHNYHQRGVESRETMYFLGMYLRAVRALDFLTAQPEWDGRTLVVSGASQGGAQAIADGGLDPRVTFIAAGVPALSDLTGVLADRPLGWPHLLPPTREAAEQRPEVIEAVRYFDAMNFATRTRVGAFVVAGFVDVVCPPGSVYATYNNLPGAKRIFNDVAGGHRSTPAADEARNQAILDHLKARR